MKPDLNVLIDFAINYFKQRGIEAEATSANVCGDLPAYSLKVEQLQIPGITNYKPVRMLAQPYDINLYKYKEIEYIRITYVYEKADIWVDVVPKGQILQSYIYKKNLDRTDDFLVKEPVLDGDLMQEIKNLIEPLFDAKKAKKFRDYDCFVKRGILLFGPPGNGKSMLAGFISDFPYFTVAHQYFTGQFIDESFEEDLSYCSLAIFDDIDMNLLDRKSGTKTSEFLSILDKSTNTKNQVRIFTTNEEIDGIDKAFLRPGRIDRIYKIELPSAEMRKRYINRWHDDIKSNLNIDKIINQSEDWSFAKLNDLKTSMVNRFLLEGVWDSNKAYLDVTVNEKPKKRTKTGF